MAVLHARSVISGSFSVASTSLSVTAESRGCVFEQKRCETDHAFYMRTTMWAHSAAVCALVAIAILTHTMACTQRGRRELAAILGV